jgi:hypothetical protein
MNGVAMHCRIFGWVLLIEVQWLVAAHRELSPDTKQRKLRKRIGCSLKTSIVFHHRLRTLIDWAECPRKLKTSTSIHSRTLCSDGAKVAYNGEVHQ